MVPLTGLEPVRDRLPADFKSLTRFRIKCPEVDNSRLFFLKNCNKNPPFLSFLNYFRRCSIRGIFIRLSPFYPSFAPDFSALEG